MKKLSLALFSFLTFFSFQGTPYAQKPTEILVVCDMQKDAPANRKDNKKNFNKVKHYVKQQIVDFSKKENGVIIFLKYKGQGEIIEDLYLKTLNSDNKAKIIVLEKDEDSGAEVIEEYLANEQKITLNQNDPVSICGVNAAHCVYETARDLRKKHPDVPIKIVKKACGTFHGDYQKIENYIEALKAQIIEYK